VGERIVLDEAACVGHGRCYTLAPDVFDADDEGHCLVRVDVVAGDLASRARIGASNCPERALEVIEDS
jgi:ferredoxin